MKNFLKYSFFLGLMTLMFTACSKMDDSYKEFIKNGEIIYTGKVDSLKAFPGKNRIKLTYLLVSDPKITMTKIFWNNHNDSLEVPVTRTTGVDTINVMLNNMPEDLYTFDVYTYDNAGHSSVKEEVSGSVYGENYINTLYNRPIDTVLMYPATKELNIKWFGVSAQAVSVEIKYTDTLGNQKTWLDLPVKNPARPADPPAFKDMTIIPDYKQGTTLSYRTGYFPVANSIDTFYTEFQDFHSTIYVAPPPPPPPSANANMALGQKVITSSGSGSKLTDGDRSSGSKWQPSSSERADLNVWFYVDLGAQKDINTTQVYFTKDPKKITYYEVLVATDTKIGSSTKWTRAFIKFGQPDAEDINSFSTLKARYVKVNIGLRDSGSNINVSEIEVYKN